MEYGGAPLDITDFVNGSEEEQIFRFETMELDIMVYNNFSLSFTKLLKDNSRTSSPSMWWRAPRWKS
jgi:hypothetical protein